MPPRRSKQRHQRGRPKARRTSEPPSSLEMYRDPVRFFGAANEADLHTLVLTRENLLIPSAGGVLATVGFDNNPNAAANWSNLVNVFDEHNVLAIEFWYVPFHMCSKSVTVTTPLLIVIDHNDNAALFLTQEPHNMHLVKGLLSMTRLNFECECSKSLKRASLILPPPHHGITLSVIALN